MYRLRKLFYSRCSAGARAELSHRAWLDWTAGLLPAPLASLVFSSRLSGEGVQYKLTWRFLDFAHFCAVFGAGDAREQLTTLLAGRTSLPLVVEILSTDRDLSSNEQQRISRSRSVLGDDSGVLDSVMDLTLRSTGRPLPAELVKALEDLAPDATVETIATRLAQEELFLMGLKELRVLACCVFGVQPQHRDVEKSLITELQLRHALSCAGEGRGSLSSLGVAGTEWCLVPRGWWDEWQRRVGGSGGSTGGTGGATGQSARLGEIANMPLLKQTNPPVLLPDTALGVNVEAVPPAVFAALQLWYSPKGRGAPPT